MKIDYLSRLRRLQSVLEIGEAVLISRESDVYYFSGIEFASDARLLVTRKKAFVISDSRYRYELSMLAPAYSPREIELDLPNTLKIICPRRIRRLYIDPLLPINEYQDIAKAMKGIVSVGKDIFTKIRRMRMIKDATEIAILKRNFRLHKKLIDSWRARVEGLTEIQAARLWKVMVLEAGCEDEAFPSIVAAGSSSSFPHYRPSGRRVTLNKALLFDSGISRHKYKTDLTRIFFVDKMGQRYREYLKIVKEAQEAAFSLIRPGVRLRDLDIKVRSFLKQYGLDGYFIHSLGHGLGLEVHELPRVSSSSQATAVPGMVFTVEPGIYIPGKFGIRIEDVVLVKEDGYELL